MTKIENDRLARRKEMAQARQAENDARKAMMKTLEYKAWDKACNVLVELTCVFSRTREKGLLK